MLFILGAVTIGPWLALWAVFAARAAASASARAGDGPPERGGPSPAVVSLLAGRLESLGYPATLLDLAARGWFRLEGQPGEPVMCVLGGNRPGDDLTGYERQAYAHVVTRAGDRLRVPAAALSDGFAGPAGASDRRVKSAKDVFMEAFRRDVIEDSRRRGLTRARLSEAAGCLLWVAALVPAIASGLALHAMRSHAYWIPVAGFLALCTVTGIAFSREKLTPPGRAALRGWRDSDRRDNGARPAAAAYASKHAGRGAASIVPPGWPPREVAYAAALGRARAAVRLFSDTPGQPRGKAIWSSYGGSWRQITIGDPQPRTVLEADGVMLMMLGVILIALLPATIATVLLAHGELRAAAFGVMACDVVIGVRLLTKDARIPGFAEFDGQVVKAWVETEAGRTRNPGARAWPSTTGFATGPGYSPSPRNSTAGSPRGRWCTPG